MHYPYVMYPKYQNNISKYLVLYINKNITDISLIDDNNCRIFYRTIDSSIYKVYSKLFSYFRLPNQNNVFDKISALSNIEVNEIIKNKCEKKINCGIFTFDDKMREVYDNIFTRQKFKLQ